MARGISKPGLTAATSIAPATGQEAKATAAVTKIIAILTAAHANLETTVPNSLVQTLTVGGELDSAIKALMKAGISDQAARLRQFRTTLS